MIRDPREIARRALALVGTPYRPKGRLPLGLDCLGLVLASLDLPPNSIGRYPAAVRPALAARLVEPFGRIVHGAEPEEGRVVLNVRRFFHLGVAVEVRGGVGVVHADLGSGRVVLTEWGTFAPDCRLELKGR
jgi:hypothetical protein